MDYIKLRNAVENSKISITELFKKLDINRGAFYYMIDKQTMKVDVLEKICAILELSPGDFLKSSDPRSLVKEPQPAYITKNDGDLQKELIQTLKELNECRKENYKLINQIKPIKK